MPWLVDGDNLLGAWPGRARTAAERQALALELRALANRERRRIVVVFDGAPSGPAPGVDVEYSGAGRSADDCILARLRAAADPAGWTVVTNDRSLADRCRWSRARVEACHVFRRRVPRQPAGEKPEREDDAGYWLRVFGGD